MPAYEDIRALVATRFDESACCLACGIGTERWRLSNGICKSCTELEEGGQAHV